MSEIYYNLSGTTKDSFKIKNHLIVVADNEPNSTLPNGTLWLNDKIYIKDSFGWSLLSPSRITTICEPITLIDFDIATHHSVVIDKNCTLKPIGNSCRGIIEITNTSNYTVSIDADRPSDLAEFVSSGNIDMLSFINISSWKLVAYVRGYV